MPSPAPEAQVDDLKRVPGEQSQPGSPATESAAVAKSADADAADGATNEPRAEAGDTAEEPKEQADIEDGEVDAAADSAAAAPPLPSEPAPDGPPLPSEPIPDDGWDCQFDPSTQAWFFHNRFTGKTQWDNPRVPAGPADRGGAALGASSAPQPPAHEMPAAGGYNPAIHGDYDPNAWYAKGAEDEEADGLASGSAAAAADMYAATVAFNRHTGGFQTEDMGPGRHTDDAKAHRQMNAYFDADAASAAHDGRSLKAERQNKKPSKAEVKAFKEKRRARKEEKRRAWLRD